MLVIYKASAGSGKTFTLAKTYIIELLGVQQRIAEDDNEYRTYRVLNRAVSEHAAHLLQDNRHRGILAITFTRKATEEMKTRILNELHLLTIVQPDGTIKSDYAADLLDMFNEHPQMRCTPQQLAQTAKIALQQILFDYRNFHVSTIDSFFQQVLRTFARELDFKSNYNIELEDEAVMGASVSALFDAFNNGSIRSVDSYEKNLRTLEDWLYRYMLDALRDGKKADLFNRNSGTYRSFVRQIGKINEESFKPYREDMEKFLHEGLLGQFENSLISHISAKSKAMMDDARTFAAKSGIRPEIFSLATAKKNVERILDSGAKPLSLGEIEKLRTSKKGSTLLDAGSDSPLAKGMPQEYLDPAIKLFTTLERRAAEINALEMIKKSLPQLWLLSYTLHYRDEYLRENSLLQLSSSNELVQRIISDDETPFVYERMGVDLQHFLIDEFQDTSFLQWANLRPLVTNSLAQEQDSLVIGDEKQAIYRFRNSDASILHDKIYTHMQGYDIVTKGNKSSENTNYRSSGTIVRFNNALFSRLADMLHVPEFDNVVQDIRKGYDSRPGYVRFSPAEDKIFALDQMAAEIIRQHDQGHYRWSDIAILVNKKKEGVEAVNHLTINYPQIPVLSGEALRLNSSPAVQLILSILRIIDQELSSSTDKKKQVAINNIEYALAIALGEIDAEADLNPGRMTDIILDAIDSTLAQDKDSDNASAYVNSAVGKILSERPASLVAMVETIIDKQFNSGQRARQYSYLTAFQDCVINFCQRNQGGLHAFLDWWDLHGDNATVNGASEADAVKVMTIHKSKGLEFKCVHIPFVNWPLYWSITPTLWMPTANLPLQDMQCPKPPAFCISLDSAMSLEHHPMHRIYAEERQKYLVDTLNKTYVAFTRPMAELTAWYTKPNARTSDPIIQFILEAMQQSSPDSRLKADLASGLSTTESDRPMFISGAPTVNCDDEKHNAADSEVNPDPYPVVQRTDKATNIRLDDILSTDDINSDDDASGTPGADTSKAAATSAQWLDDTARQQGLLLHDIMSQIHGLGDIATAVDRVCTRKGLPSDQQDHFKRLLATFLNPGKQNISRWFDSNATVYIEQPIYIPDKGQVRRPDRVVVYSDGSADILDYKFTDNPATVGCDEHQKQVVDYIWYVRQMGYTNVRGFLCYPMLDQIVQCNVIINQHDH